MKRNLWCIMQSKNILRLHVRRGQKAASSTSVPMPLSALVSGNLRWIDQNNGDSSEEKLLGVTNEGHTGRVPKGCLAVYVGAEQKRFVIPASYLSMPEFGILMESVEEEFGFEQKGGLHIPCEETHFEEVLARCLVMQRKNKGKTQL